MFSVQYSCDVDRAGILFSSVLLEELTTQESEFLMQGSVDDKGEESGRISEC